jgi:hypothetical protein
LYKVDGDSGQWFSLGLDIIPENIYNNLVGASIKYLLIPSIDTPSIFKRDSKRNPINAGLSPQVFIHQSFWSLSIKFKKKTQRNINLRFV